MFGYYTDIIFLFDTQPSIRIFINMIDFINSILLHPYFLAVYGVLLWQVEQWYSSKKSFKDFWKESYRNVGRSLIWVGLIIVFDDELLSKYNQWAAVDIKLDEHRYFYTIAGFFIDVIRTKIFNKF